MENLKLKKELNVIEDYQRDLNDRKGNVEEENIILVKSYNKKEIIKELKIRECTWKVTDNVLLEIYLEKLG